MHIDTKKILTFEDVLFSTCRAIIFTIGVNNDHNKCNDRIPAKHAHRGRKRGRERAREIKKTNDEPAKTIEILYQTQFQL